MGSSEALDRALAMEPDRPGVARLCQELLAELTGRRIAPARPALGVYPGGRRRSEARRWCGGAGVR